MRRIIAIVFIVIALLVVSCTSGDARKIAQLEETIQDLRGTIAELEAERNDEIADAQATLEFANEGLALAERLAEAQKTMLVFGMSVLLGDDLTYDNLGGALVEITAVTESLEWLYAPPSAIEVKDSLLQECHFSVDHFNAILGCWQASERGDQYWFDNDYDEAHRIYEDEICPLQNRVRLINLKLQAEQDLE